MHSLPFRCEQSHVWCERHQCVSWLNLNICQILQIAHSNAWYDIILSWGLRLEYNNFFTVICQYSENRLAVGCWLISNDLKHHKTIFWYFSNVATKISIKCVVSFIMLSLSMMWPKCNKVWYPSHKRLANYHYPIRIKCVICLLNYPVHNKPNCILSQSDSCFPRQTTISISLILWQNLLIISLVPNSYSQWIPN